MWKNIRPEGKEHKATAHSFLAQLELLPRADSGRAPSSPREQHIQLGAKAIITPMALTHPDSDPVTLTASPVPCLLSVLCNCMSLTFRPQLSVFSLELKTFFPR